MWDVTNTPPCRHNILVVSHGIAGPNGTNPHIGVGEPSSDTICNDPAQPCRYCPLRAQGALTALKRVYKVERSSYLYSARKFLPYPMWDVTKNASPLYPRIRAHHWPRIPRFLILPILKENLATPRLRGATLRRTRGYWTPPSLVRYSVGPPRCCEGLRHSVESFAAAYPRLLIHFLILFFASGLFFYYLASFFILISSCPVKHYYMED